MDQINYQSHENYDRFDPVERPNVLPALDRRNARLQKGEERFLQGLRQNTQTKIQNAKRQGEDLIALSKFSQSLVDYLTEKGQAEMEERIKSEDAAGEAAAYQDYMNGTFKSDPTYDQATAQFDQTSDAANAAGQSILDEEGNNYPAVRQIRETTGQYQMGYQRAKSRMAALEFPGWLDNEMSKIDMTGMNESEREAAVQGLRSKFMSEYGLSGLHPQFLAREVYPTMIKQMAGAQAGVRKEARIEDSFRVRQEAAATFTGDRDVNRYLTTLAGTVDDNGNKLGYAGAWKEFSREVTNQVKSGLIDESVISQMESQPIPGDPKGRTYGELHQSKFTQIRKDIRKVRQTEYRADEADRKQLMEQTERDLIDAFNDDPDGVTDAQIEEFQEKFVKQYGRRSSALDAYKTNQSVDSQTKKKQEEQITTLINSNLLNMDRLRKFHPDLQKKYRSIAQQQGKAMASNPDYKVQMTAVKDAVEIKANVTRDTANHPSVGLKVAQLQQQLMAEIQKQTLAGNENAAQDALSIVLQRFEAEQSDPNKAWNDQRGYSDVMPPLLDTTNNARKASLRIETLNDALQYDGVLDREYGLFSKGELEAFSKGMDKPGWRPAPMVVYAAQKLGVDPLTVLNKQLKAAGMNEIPPPPSIEITQNELTPTQQRLLNQFPTPERSQRALTGVKGPFKPELIPSHAQQYVPFIEKAAKTYGIPAAILAGLIETESSWDPRAVSPVGARGLTQIMPEYHPGVNYNDPETAIMYAAEYLKRLMDDHGFDLNTAIKAYNGGPGGIDKSRENREYLPKVLKAAGKYGYGQQVMREPAVMRSTSPVLAYVAGDIGSGPYYTGQHTDIKKVGGGYFEYNALDDYVEIEDREYGRIPIGKLPQTGDWQSHTRRGSHGRDYGSYAGDKIYVKNGAKVVGKPVPTANGDRVTIELPNGDRYELLHGKAV